MSVSDEEAYREAVRAGNFMAMRRAAYTRPEKSAKLGRLGEIVREAGENGQKTVVFSYFKDVLGMVGEALAGGVPVHGPLTGGVPSVRRQQVVDDFAAVPGPAVLLAQIQAGGTGLNMQAASVVVICEPQIKPTLVGAGRAVSCRDSDSAGGTENSTSQVTPPPHVSSTVGETGARDPEV